MKNPAEFNFRKETPAAVIAVIQRLYENKHRARFFYGDLATGRDWMEENDVTGYVGKSTGTQPIPLLVHNTRSMGGGGLTGSIVKIVDTQTGATLYQHPNYHQPRVTVGPSDLPEYGAAVFFDGELVARCKNSQQAERLAAFWRGERNAK